MVVGRWWSGCDERRARISARKEYTKMRSVAKSEVARNGGVVLGGRRKSKPNSEISTPDANSKEIKIALVKYQTAFGGLETLQN